MTDLNCVTASGQSLEILEEAQVVLKILGFSWKWKFLVSANLTGSPILGADFITKSWMVMDLARAKCHSDFEPRIKIPFCRRRGYSWCAARAALSKSFPQIKTGHLLGPQRSMLESLVRWYPDVLSERLGLTTLIEYDIQVLDKTPVSLPPYRLSPPKMRYLREHLKTLLREGVIEPSNSHYSSPMFLVPKSDGTFRPVEDFRALNKRILVESVPLPDVHAAFDWFKDATVFTTLDLNQAYYKIPLSKESKPLTAFCTDWNLYQFNRLPFGLATGAQVLSRLLDRVFQDIKFEFVYHYPDDVVVYSKDFAEHLKHANIVFERLRKAGLTVKPQKVVFATKEISFLGHLVSQRGVKIKPERTRAISQFPAPRDAKIISRFIGMVNYYHKFIPHLADIAAHTVLQAQPDRPDVFRV
jgi:hypothetical protein